MSNQAKLSTLRARLQQLSSERDELQQLRKFAFMPAPPMPQGGAPPMDPAMMQQGGMPPVDPATGMPMDPAMMQQGGMPPMDPAMMQQGGMPPVDPATGMPMDPAMMQQGGAPPAPPAPPAITPEMLDQIVGLLEEIGQRVEALTAENQQIKQQLDQGLAEINDQMIEMDKSVAMLSAKNEAQPPATGGW